MKYLVWSALVFAFVTHIVIPWQNVFQSSVVLATPDAYSMLYCADNNITVWDGGVAFFASIIVAFGRMFHLSNVVSEAVLPPVLFFLTLIPLYVVAKVIFNKYVATGAIVIYCLLPGELLERTKLGAGDYHCWEIFIVTSVMACVVLAIDNRKRWLSIAGAVFLLLIYQMALLKIILIPLVVILSIGLFAFLRVKGWLWKVGMVTLYLVILTVAHLALPGLFYQAVGLASIQLDTITNEMMPLFFTAGQFDTWVTTWNYFGAVFFFSLFGLGWMLYKVIRYKRANDVLFFTWTVIMLWLTIAERRSAYYSAANIAILTSLVIYEYGMYWVKNKERLIKYSIVVVLIVCAPLMSISVRAASISAYAPSTDWQKTCQWLSTQPSGKVLSEWSYGYWIMAIGKHEVVSKGAGPDPAHERILVSDSLKWSQAELKKEDIKYIIIDRVMVEDNIETTIKNSIYRNIDKYDTFAYRMYYFSEPIYQSGEVKVFAVE
jgi:asparagine N-glycosylation enzyme membrane subunit Stt3